MRQDNAFIEISRLETDFETAYSFTLKNRKKIERKWSAYTGFDNGQWPEEAVNNLKSQNRHIVQYNFIRGKIDGLAGHISQTDMDIDFIPTESEYGEMTRILKELMLSDKELLDWNREFSQVVVDGLVHQGVEQIVISDKYSVLGNIGFERIQPGNIILDPQWKSHNSADLKRAWKVSYMTAKEMKALYSSKTAQIERLIALQKLHASNYRDDETTESMQYAQLADNYGDLYRVVEHHYMEEKPVEVSVVFRDGVKMEIPYDLDEETRKEFMKTNKIKKSEIIKHRRVDRIYKIKTTCRQLSPSLFLEDAPAEIQIGRLPFFPWSAARINGVDSGVVELLIDAQQTLNKRESLADHIISSSAHGAQMIDPAVVNNDQAMLKDILENIDKPNGKIITAPGALASGRRYTQLIEKAQYQGEIYQDIQRMVDTMDRISRQTATMDGQNQSSHETGVLFARKQMQGEIAMSNIMQSIQQHWNDKAEAYMTLCKDVYSGVYREFRTKFADSASDEIVKLNEPTYDEQGNRFISLDLAKLPRHKVIVSKSPAGQTMKLTDRAVNIELMQAIPQENYLSRAQITRNIIKTLNMSDEDTKKMEEAADLEYQSAMARMNLEIESSKAQVEQIHQQIQQADQQMAMQKMGMQPGNPDEQGGQPQEGGQQPAPQK